MPTARGTPKHHDVEPLLRIALHVEKHLLAAGLAFSPYEAEAQVATDVIRGDSCPKRKPTLSGAEEETAATNDSK